MLDIRLEPGVLWFQRGMHCTLTGFYQDRSPEDSVHSERINLDLLFLLDIANIPVRLHEKFLQMWLLR